MNLLSREQLPHRVKCGYYSVNPSMLLIPNHFCTWQLTDKHLWLKNFKVMKMFALTSALVLEVGEKHQLLREDKQA